MAKEAVDAQAGADCSVSCDGSWSCGYFKAKIGQLQGAVHRGWGLVAVQLLRGHHKALSGRGGESCLPSESSRGHDLTRPGRGHF